MAFLYSLNPMVGVIDGFRWSILGDRIPLDPLLPYPLPSPVVFSYRPLVYFRKTERNFADVI